MVSLADDEMNFYRLQLKIIKNLISFTLNFSCHAFSMGQVAQVLIAIAIQLTFGLQFFVPMDILWRKLAPGISKEKHNVSQVALRAGCILIMGAVAAAVPKLDPFISLVGAIFFSFLGKHILIAHSFK